MPDQKDLGTMLNAYGVSAPSGGFSGALIMAWIIFGMIGFCAFNYGRKERAYQPMVLGIVMMIYPYFIHNTWLLYLIGAALTAGLYFWRD